MQAISADGGRAGIQTAQAVGGIGAASAVVRHPVPRNTTLLTFAEVGQEILGGVSERTARKVLDELGVVPVVLGPRVVRIVRAEAEAAVLTKLPRRSATGEPHQLLRGKVEALKRGGRASFSEARAA